MLNIGIIGVGGISHAHRVGWREIPEAKVVAVCDVRAENARAAAEELGARAYQDIDAMLAAETSLDAVDICLPTYLHADCAVKALERGLHVITEKPVSLDAQDVGRIFGAAERNARKVMVAQVLRFWREYAVLKQAIDSGRYGRLLSGSMSRIGAVPGRSWNHWMRDAAASGLVPYDLHIHDLDFLVYALGKPTGVTAHRAKAPTQYALSAVYEFPGCFVATEAAWLDVAYRFQAGYRFQFERAVLEYRGGTLTTYLADGAVETLKPEDEVSVAGVGVLSADPYRNELRYFTDCVLNDRPCALVPPEDLETVLGVIEGIVGA